MSFPYGRNCQPGQLEMGHAKWDADDRDAEQDTEEDVAKSEQPSKEDEPDDIRHRRARTRPRLSHHCPTKGPKTESSHPEGRHHQRDGDDQDDGEEPGDHVPEGHLQPAENQPEDVPDEPHGAATLARSLRSVSPSAGCRQTADGRRQASEPYHLLPDRSSARAQTPASRAYAPPLGDQFVGGPLLHDPAVIDHYHLIGSLRRLQTGGRSPSMSGPPSSAWNARSTCSSVPGSRLEVASSSTTRTGASARALARATS